MEAIASRLEAIATSNKKLLVARTVTLDLRIFSRTEDRAESRLEVLVL